MSKEYENVSRFEVDARFVSAAEASLGSLPVEKQQLSDFWREKYEKEHAKNWDKFYRNNKTNFFKDRHYLEREFEVDFGRPIAGESLLFVEMGCGVGNALLPLVERNEHMTGVGLDCSKVAIDLLNSRVAEFQPESSRRCRGFVMDMTSSAGLSAELEEYRGKADYVSLIFSLSAVHPKQHKQVLENVRTLLKPGGILLFRDYAKYDLAQLRFAGKQARIDEDFYVRGDGTKAKFFTEGELRELIGEFGEEVQLKIHSRKFVNRKDNLEMHRLWIQGVWKFI